MGWGRGCGGLLLALSVFLSSRAAQAQEPGPHRINGEVGYFELPKYDDPGYAFGLGYAYRVRPSVELGGSLRYFSEFDDYGGTANRFWFAGLSLRTFGTLDAKDRVELGISVRAGALGVSDLGLCCAELALAPDLRLWVAPGVALQLAPELAFVVNGESDNTNAAGAFLQQAFWLSVVVAP